jgi:hypothetical protein
MKRPWSNLTQYLEIFLDKLRKGKENLIYEDSRSPGQNLIPGPPKYEVRVLSTQPRHSVTRQRGTL